MFLKNETWIYSLVMNDGETHKKPLKLPSPPYLSLHPTDSTDNWLFPWINFYFMPVPCFGLLDSF